MEILQTERRAACHVPSASSRPIAVEKVVRQGILLQGVIGTPGAVEYLKANGIEGTVIGRVLSGGTIRGEDEALRDKPRAWD